MATYPFLSEDWMNEARAIWEAHRGEAPPPPVTVKANLVITDVPFGEGKVNAHLDTSGGEMELDLGHLDKPDATVTVDHATARAAFVGGDMGALMQAFMSGKMKVQGDMAKLMAMGAAAQIGGDAKTVELSVTIARELQAITE